jgi:transglutaminase-like putative cysteine protease
LSECFVFTTFGKNYKMDLLKLISFFVLIFFNLTIAQKNNYTTANIPKELTENANLIFRELNKEITISSQKSMTSKEKVVLTVLNEQGWSATQLGEFYDNSTKVKSIEAVIYDTQGKEIKKFKQKDFKDISLADGFSVYTDNRLVYLEYVPLKYPFTIVYESHIESSNTAFIPQWNLLTSYHSSIENTSIIVTYPPDLGFRYKEYNFDLYDIKKAETPNSVRFSATNIPALKYEDYAPNIKKLTPHIKFALNKFHLEGVKGEATSWEELGNWMNTDLLAKTNELPESTKKAIRDLVKDQTDPIEKAKLVYQYVQDKTRYVSIQLGIGGWKPMLAKDVDRLGYGDCKALTNYTKALLESVDVPSYYTVIYSNRDKQSMTEDFVSMQGNHIILALPDGDNMNWLECTSQITPFNFLGNSTDDRLALVIKPEGGELLRTHIYDTPKNIQFSKAEYTINESGKLIANIDIKTKGIQYDNRFYLDRQSKEDLKKHYKDYFYTINNLAIKDIKLNNDKNQIEFTEKIVLEAENYAQQSGDRLIFAINPFNQYSKIPQRYRNRQNPFEIKRGFTDQDEFTVSLPDGFNIEALPENIEINSKFGTYKLEVSLQENVLTYKRNLITYEGSYSKEEYEEFRNFREQIARNDNAKVVLIKK